jgi:hypothetical protein
LHRPQAPLDCTMVRLDPIIAIAPRTLLAKVVQTAFLL